MNRTIKKLLVGFLLAISVASAENRFADALSLLINNEKYAESEKILTSIIEDCQSLSKSGLPLVINGYKINLPFVYSSRADCWFGLEQYNKARDDYSVAYQSNGDSYLLYRIARCMYEVGRYNEAIFKFDECLAANSKLEGEYLVRYFRACSVFQSGDMNQGIRDLEKLKISFSEVKDTIQITIDQCVSEKKRIDALYEQKKASGCKEKVSADEFKNQEK